jgi:cyclophilin family peptidyl-prolyl cis-trans isomerase
MKKIFVFMCLLGFGAAAVAGDDYVLFETNFGDIVIDLYPEQAPITVDNFKDYVNDDFYDGLIFHRVMPGFMIQGGAFDEALIFHDPTRDPINNEFGESNVRGTIAMAKSPGDPDSATSQFFINLVDNSSNLDVQNGGFTVFGEVSIGMESVDAIAQVSTSPVSGVSDYVPDEAVIIENATVIPEPATILLLGMGCLAFVRRRGTGSI